MKRNNGFMNRWKKYINNSSLDFQDRAFVLFSFIVLIALYLAIPCGIIMHEPLSATISTLIGALAFTGYVIYSAISKNIKQARIFLSVIVVFIFLPVMFFTNGGAGGGAPIWLLLGTIYIALILEGKFKVVMLICNIVITAVCWILGYIFPEWVTEYSRGGNYFDSIAALFIVGAIIFIMINFQNSLSRKEEEHKNLQRLFEQTAVALANAIDAKDKYTHGHSSRVAEYSKKIAELGGMSEEECEEIYYIALLHDVGKIGIPESIINKNGKLTDEEFAKIKEHPTLGAQILHSINEYPNLSIGAHFHHERYDGKGYPVGLKGEDIPEFARIIAVADAYDAMTSERSYREAIPQQTVREEIVKGAGTQFDPKYAKIMQILIDMDTEYEMKERLAAKELSGKNDIVCLEYMDNISDGIVVTPEILHIQLKSEPADEDLGKESPSLILFDSLDGRAHKGERGKKDLCYFEYAEIQFDGDSVCKGARKIKVEEKKNEVPEKDSGKGFKKYSIDAVKRRDHILIRLNNGIKTFTFIIALPDSSRFAYIGLTGENTRLFDVSIEKEEGYVPEDYIPRIAEEVSYIKGPSGDLPNIQVDGYRTASTEGVPLKEEMTITFHTMSLPTARLVWHCAFVDLFYSPDKKMYGDGYKEYALIRLDGENWEAEHVAKNELIVNKKPDFKGWDAWKEANKKGFDCTVKIKREGDTITTTTENLGIELYHTTVIVEEPEELYVGLTGDQCAITNIRIS